MENPVPYIVHESAEARSERTIKRLVIALIVAVALMFASNAAWLWCWMQYDYYSEETVTTIDSEGNGFANYTGGNGGIIYGKSDGAQIDEGEGETLLQQR